MSPRAAHIHETRLLFMDIRQSNGPRETKANLSGKNGAWRSGAAESLLDDLVGGWGRSEACVVGLLIEGGAEHLEQLMKGR